MRRRLIYILAAIAGFFIGRELAAQTPPACPTSFYAAGASLNRTATPELAGFYAIATPLTKCGASFQVYSMTTNLITPRGSGKTLTFTSTTSTGAAIPLKQIGPVNIFTFGNVGVSSTGGGNRLGSNWGGFAVIPAHFWSLQLIPIGQSVDGKWMAGLAIGRSW